MQQQGGTTTTTQTTPRRAAAAAAVAAAALTDAGTGPALSPAEMEALEEERLHHAAMEAAAKDQEVARLRAE